MNIKETISMLDELLRECDLDAAEKLLSEVIEESHNINDMETEKYFLNEQIGFYRDCGRFPESLASAKRARKLFENSGDTKSLSYATTLLNCANAYRAAGDYDDAFKTYDIVKAIYSELLPEDDDLIASFYNNIALLYQETKQWKNACDSLEDALEIVRSKNDETRIAISCTNLAVSLIHIGDIEKAMDLLSEADEILAGRSPSDFHYSAVLAGFGDAYYNLSEYQKAVDYYEKALSEIELHMGENNFYSIVTENLERAYNKLGKSRCELSGLELSQKFFYAFGEPMLKKNFSFILPEISIGLAGEGSECLGYDDEFSRDHDFGAGFCIWVPDDMSDKIVEKLRKAYELLPKVYCGIRRIETKNAKGRIGVCRIGDFFERLLGMRRIPDTEEEWLSVDESMLAAVCSGMMFEPYGGKMKSYRSKLSNNYPKPVKLRRLAQQTALMAQGGQYNYIRMRKRGDFASAQIYLSKFCLSAMRAAHLLNNVYAPYEKWIFRSTESLDGFKEYADKIKALLTCQAVMTSEFNENEDKACVLIQEICYEIAEKISKEMSIENMEDNVYLNDTAEVLAKKAFEIEKHERLEKRIVELEWQAFDKVQNIGGRASCQDNWETFSIMRSSQYRTWQTEILEKWTDEFENAYKNGRNLIMEKYARMMESTDPEKYDELKKELPEISDEFIKMREAIVSIQVTWMEKFAENYPVLASDARTIHTKDDTVFSTSYETYLRGELTTYSSDMLYLYGRWIVKLYKSGKNLAYMIMEETVHAYGYKSLDEAEENAG